jgi:hypothetical protein
MQITSVVKKSNHRRSAARNHLFKNKIYIERYQLVFVHFVFSYIYFSPFDLCPLFQSVLHASGINKERKKRNVGQHIWTDR